MPLSELLGVAAPASPAHTSLNWRWQLAIFVVAAAVVISRRPDAFLNPQFYAEDGAVWYAQAYNLGWLHSLTLSDGGYLNSLSRLVAGLSLLVPLQFAPLVMNISGLLFQVLPVPILLSERCSSWASLPVRFLRATLYVALPNSREIGVVLTNAQWHLALVACLLTFANPPRNRKWVIFDIAVLIISGLSGPFVILLLPLALLFWWKRRQRWSLVVIALISLSAFVQIAEIAFHSADRSIAGASLGANPLTFARLFSGQVVVAALRGENRFALHASPVYACVVAAAGACVLLYCAVKANLELRLFICFATLLLFAALRSPAIAGPAAQWQLLELVPGGRYWFFPTLAFVWSLLWLAAQERVKVLRTIGVLALLVGCSGIRKDWRYPRFNDEHFAEYVHRFDVAPPGSSVAIPIYPEPLSFTLVKKR